MSSIVAKSSSMGTKTTPSRSSSLARRPLRPAPRLLPARHDQARLAARHAKSAMRPRSWRRGICGEQGPRNLRPARTRTCKTGR